MPYAIKEVQLPEAEKRCDKVLFKVLLTLNIIFPALVTPFEFIYYNAYFQTEKLPRTEKIFFDCIIYFAAILQFVSGYFLIQGLNKIRTFISSR